MVKSPIFWILFDGPLELVAGFLRRYFVSLPTEKQAEVWLSKSSVRDFCRLRNGVGPRFVEYRDIPEEITENAMGGTGGEWTIIETPTSRRLVMRRCYYDQWLIYFPGGSSWLGPKLIPALHYKDGISLLSMRDAEGIKVFGSGGGLNHYHVVKA